MTGHNPDLVHTPSEEHGHLSEREQERYLRQVQLPAFAHEGQRKLKHAKVLIIGLGGLGCPAAQYLAAAGVGEMLLVDNDTVSLGNLQRQILFKENDIGRNKATAAAERLRASNSDITIKSLNTALNPNNAHQLIKHSDLVLDCTDNFYARYLINDICAHYRTPWIYASVLGFEGQVALIQPQRSCFRCLYPELTNTPNCNEAGVVGAMPGIIGNMQALLAINYLAQMRMPALESEHNQLHLIQGISSRSITLRPSPDCELCRGSKNYHDFSADHFSRHKPELDEEFKISWEGFEKLDPQKTTLIDVRTKDEHQAYNIGGLNFPLEEIKSKFNPEANKHYVFYCQSGQRSDKAVELYQKDMNKLNQINTYIVSVVGGINLKN
ncbi:HesA/MoeB/ThiF family protein [Pseudoteredinibacter isoporae]|uniref:HesA/MoeB/ThiF family protein n=1 Tax=Pseudoteredinibacter isoporae TaxID=570281 RepID=UPI0031036873